MTSLWQGILMLITLNRNANKPRRKQTSKSAQIIKGICVFEVHTRLSTIANHLPFTVDIVRTKTSVIEASHTNLS